MNVGNTKDSKQNKPKETQYEKASIKHANISSDSEVKELRDQLNQAQVCLGQLESKLNHVL